MARLSFESLETRETPSAGVGSPNELIGRTSGMEAAASTTSDPSGNTIYVGTANGGVWKTTNGGTSNSFYGTGVYKSTDSGRTW